MKSLLPLLLGLLLAGCATTPGSRILTDQDNGRAITIPVGADAVVQLPANPTTGYDWKPAAATLPTLRLVESSYTPNASTMGLTGAGGTEIFRFRGLAPGQVTVQLNYARPWEKETAPAKSMRFTVTVAPRS
jgi:inhibitor of cysteine peptidase